MFEWIKRLWYRNDVLLCDLDGTIIETKSGKTFPVDRYDWKFKPYIKEAIQEYKPKYIFIISNQGGIEKGLVNRADFQMKLWEIMSQMQRWGDFIVRGVFCETNDKSDPMRKPNVGMVDFFRHAYAEGLDFDDREALMIGDASGKEGQFSNSDLQCAKNAGIRYVDVDDFISAMVPCSICYKNNLDCHAGEDIPFLPCDGYGCSPRKINDYLLNK